MGVTGRIAGALEPRDRVVIIEDTATAGTPLMEAVAQGGRRRAGPISVIVDRGGPVRRWRRPVLPTTPCSPHQSASSTGPGVGSRLEHARVQDSGRIGEARLIAAAAASSAGERIRWSHRVLAIPAVLGRDGASQPGGGGQRRRR